MRLCARAAALGRSGRLFPLGALKGRLGATAPFPADRSNAEFFDRKRNRVKRHFVWLLVCAESGGFVAEGEMLRQIVVETETAGDSRTMFRLRIDSNVIAEGLTAAQAHLLVGEILDRFTLPK